MLVKGNKYTYTNTVRVGVTCKRTAKQQTIVYIGTEGNKQVFESEQGIEVLIHKDDIEKFLRDTI